MNQLNISQRKACRALCISRSTLRYKEKKNEYNERLRSRIIYFAKEYGRYGYRRVSALVKQEGWQVNVKRVYRIWRQEGLKVPQKQPKRKRLWLNESSCIRLRAEYKNHVWSYDFVMDRTHNGIAYRTLNIIDEYTRECLAIKVKRRLNSKDVMDVLSELFLKKGVPVHIRSDNGPEFIAKELRKWLARVKVQTQYIEPGSPWENGYVESFNSKFRDELINLEEFETMREAEILIERWRNHYNTKRPHSSLDYKSPVPESYELHNAVA